MARKLNKPKEGEAVPLSPEMRVLLRADASEEVGRQGIQLTEKEKQFEAKVREILARKKPTGQDQKGPGASR